VRDPSPCRNGDRFEEAPDIPSQDLLVIHQRCFGSCGNLARVSGLVVVHVQRPFRAFRRYICALHCIVTLLCSLRLLVRAEPERRFWRICTAEHNIGLWGTHTASLSSFAFRWRGNHCVGWRYGFSFRGVELVVLAFAGSLSISSLLRHPSNDRERRGNGTDRGVHG